MPSTVCPEQFRKNRELKGNYLDHADRKTNKFDQQEEEFINHYAELGFSNPDEMIKKGLQLLKEELDRHAHLTQSADLYADLYDQDQALKEWTESATRDWD